MTAHFYPQTDKVAEKLLSVHFHAISTTVVRLKF